MAREIEREGESEREREKKKDTQKEWERGKPGKGLREKPTEPLRERVKKVRNIESERASERERACV